MGMKVRRLSRRAALSMLGGSLGGLLTLTARGEAAARSILGATSPAVNIGPPGDPPERQFAGDRPLRLLFWQAPTILNPHLGRGMSDFAAARCCFEPLLTADN